MKRKKGLLLVAAALIILLVTVVGVRVYKAPHPWPEWVNWHSVDDSWIQDDETVQVQLVHRRLTLLGPSGQSFYQSPEEWAISEILHGDIDRDGQEEIILLVWKEGSFGDHLPFWMDENDSDLSQHIFIFDWDKNREDRLNPIWMSSAMGIQAAEISLQDNMITITTPEGKETRWVWEGWGLTLIES